MNKYCWDKAELLECEKFLPALKINISKAIFF